MHIHEFKYTHIVSLEPKVSIFFITYSLPAIMKSLSCWVSGSKPKQDIFELLLYS